MVLKILINKKIIREQETNLKDKEEKTTNDNSLVAADIISTFSSIGIF